ncbi:MAG: lytic transglycosylase domain-containing protein [Gemmatimonadetes bacterium]|nr:lytic transglycosylase domain-containing protein [Gemmatimonadota bacterium]
MRASLPHRPVLIVATLLLCTLPGALAAQSRSSARGREASSAQVIQRRLAEAEAREQKRLAWAARRPGITVAAAHAPEPAGAVGPEQAPAPAPAPQLTPAGPGAPGSVSETAIAADLRSLARSMGVEERLDERRVVALAPMIAAEAARYALPAALLIAIIQLESEYNPDARSRVGATGLMQVMPWWPRDLGYRFGKDLTDESTNVRYGSWVLQDALEATDGDVRRALLRYNGCRTGSNTPGCFSYPDRIRRLVERVATATCSGRGWEECVVAPLRKSRTEAD